VAGISIAEFIVIPFIVQVVGGDTRAVAF